MEHPYEMSVDNETLDTLHSAVVLTVGAVVFRGSTIVEKIYFAVDVQEQIDRGRTISGSTIMWWLVQDEKARRALIEPTALKISTGRAILREWGARCEHIWARPAMFDLPMLRSLFGQDLWDDMEAKRHNHGYQKERDLNSLARELDPLGLLKPPFEGTAHCALDDALHHHTWLMNMRRYVEKQASAVVQPAGWDVGALVPQPESTDPLVSGGGTQAQVDAYNRGEHEEMVAEYDARNTPAK